MRVIKARGSKDLALRCAGAEHSRPRKIEQVRDERPIRFHVSRNER